MEGTGYLVLLLCTCLYFLEILVEEIRPIQHALLQVGSQGICTGLTDKVTSSSHIVLQKGRGYRLSAFTMLRVPRGHGESVGVLPVYVVFKKN